MSTTNPLARLFQHQLEQPRSIMCFYTAWPIAAILLVMAVADYFAGEFVTVAVELSGAIVFLLVPPFFKTEHQYKLIRILFSLVIFAGFLVALLTRLPTFAGMIWLPLFPIAAYILLGARVGHPMVISMWLAFVLLAPFETLGLHNSVMLGSAFAIATVIANKYESTLRLYHDRLSHLAEKDLVTDTANRRAMLAYLDSLADHFQPLSLLMIDIDHFKQINDRHGHPAGDRALRKVVKLIEGLLRGKQRIGRWGGDEFIVVLPEVPMALAGEIADRLRQSIEQADAPSISIGVACRNADEPISDLIYRADQALYRAKSGGRNRVEPAVAIA